MINNPLYDHWRATKGRRYSTFTGTLRGEDSRDIGVRTWAWAVPDEEALLAIAELGPIIEVGAGRGYWASLLAGLGVDILAFDDNPPDEEPNGYFSREPVETYHPVHNHDHTIAGEHPDRTLMMVWPCYDDPWAHEAVKLYREAGGKRVVFVGESQGGCNADDGFFQYMDHYAEVADSHYIPTWQGIHDQLVIYEFIENPEPFVETSRCLECWEDKPVDGFVRLEESWERRKDRYGGGTYDHRKNSDGCADCYQEWLITHTLTSGD